MTRVARLRRAEIAERANAARSEKQKGRTQKGDVGGHVAPDVLPPPPPALASGLAERARVSPRTVKRVQRLRREDPEAFEELAAKGELPRRGPGFTG